MGGTVEGLFTTRAAGRPMAAHEAATAVVGRGLLGDRYHDGVGYYSDRPSEGGGREVTLIEAEELDRLLAERGIELTPVESRRNVVTRGIRLLDLIGARFRIGEVVCEGVKICEPCDYLEGLTGKAVNAPLVHRAGLRANVLVGGTIHVGDAVEAVPASEAVPATGAVPVSEVLPVSEAAPAR